MSESHGEGCCSHNIHFKTTCHIFHLCHIFVTFYYFYCEFLLFRICFSSLIAHHLDIYCLPLIARARSARSQHNLTLHFYSSFLLFIMLGSLPKISSQMILIQFCIYLFTIFKSLFFLFLYLTCSNYTCLCMFTVTIIPIIRISLLFH